MAGIKSVFGGGSANAMDDWKGGFKTTEQLLEALEVLKKYGVNTIDTAQMYTGSEQLLGDAKAGSGFIIDTKTPGGLGGGETKTKEDIISEFHESIKKLGVDKVDILYIHSPHQNEPYVPTLEAITSLHKSNLIQRFGLSNHSPTDVQKIHTYTTTHGLVPPTVYQGNYNAVSRGQETQLFPVLRNLGISFYAYSPIAGGFLSKTKEQILAGSGRFGDQGFVGKIYNAMYNQPAILDALTRWGDLAAETGVTPADLAFRWVKYNSALEEGKGDALIIGASSLGQLEQTLVGLEAGPLSVEVVEKIDAIWEGIKDVAPTDNISEFLKIAAAGGQ